MKRENISFKDPDRIYLYILLLYAMYGYLYTIPIWFFLTCLAMPFDTLLEQVSKCTSSGQN